MDVIFFLTKFCYVAQVDFKLEILLPQPRTYWDDKPGPLCLTLQSKADLKQWPYSDPQKPHKKVTNVKASNRWPATLASPPLPAQAPNPQGSVWLPLACT